MVDHKKRNSENSFAILSFLRWFSAFLVVIGHVRHLVFTDYKNLDSVNIAIKAFYFITGFGYEAVIIFFVLSGFLVGGISVEKYKKNKFSIKDYSIHRICRIYTVLIPAILMGFLLDKLGLTYFNQSEIYTNSLKYQTILLNFQISEQLNLSTFIGNLFSLQTIVVPVFGSNGPLWSLSNECWYYVIFGLLIYFYKFDTRWRYIFISLSLLIFAYFFPVKIVLWGLVWLVGAFVPYKLARMEICKVPKLVIMLALILFISYLRFTHNVESLEHNSPILKDLLRDITLALLVSTFIAHSISKRKDPYNERCQIERVNNSLSSFSFSLYVFHFPMMIFLSAVLYGSFGFSIGMKPSLIAFLWFFVFLVLLYIYSYLMFFLAEEHTGRVRKYFNERSFG